MFNINDIKKYLKTGTIIGEGSFGNVYIATYKGEQYALKRLHKEKLRKQYDYNYLLGSFFKEFECMRKCSCENSVKFYFYFITKNHLHIIMELCDSDLQKQLNGRSKGYSAEEIKIIMTQLNNAFKKLNENNLIHRDLKLENIFIKYTDKNEVGFIPKLGDYGFTKELEQKKASTFIGTPTTMAPEVMRYQSYNSKADLWSVGTIIYELHFKEPPYGTSTQVILKKLNEKTPYKQAEDPKLRDLINKLLEVDQDKRLSWEEYFCHAFFTSDLKSSNTTNENLKYKIIEDFDIGFKNRFIKCYIAQDNKNGRKVLIKSYDKAFIKQHQIFFNKECELNKVFKGNKHIIELIDIEYEEKVTNLIFKYEDIEILPSYITHKEMTEKQLQIINKKLLENIFLFNECNFKSFIFISIYSFAITKDEEPILFDFGLNKLFIPSNEILSYYMPNKAEIGNLLYQSKTNIMNYGITLIKCLYGNDFKIIIDNKSLYLPQDKNISKEFSDFLSQSLCKNIDKRSNWFNLYNHPFVKQLKIDSTIDSINSNTDILLDNEKLDIIFEILNEKFKLINNYYEKQEFNEKTKYINEIEIFLNLTLYEELLILKLFDRNLKTKPFTAQNEISLIFIKEKNNFRFNINFVNPIFKTMKIVNLTNNKLIFDFISQLKKHINKLKDICLNIHKITKSIFKGNYFDFLKKFIEMVEVSKYHDYFYSLFTKINNCIQDKQFDKAYDEIPIAQYICELIGFYNANMFQNNKDTIYFDNKELLKQFNDIFKEIKITKAKKDNKDQNKFILISFLGVLFRYYNNSIDINENHLQQQKASLDGFINFYSSLKELSLECENNLKYKH